MGYEIHEKKSAQGTRFRVWDSRSSGYWHKPLTKEQLQDALLAEMVERAVGDLTQQFSLGRDSRLPPTVKVQKWNRQSKDDIEYPEGYWRQRMAEIYGAEITTNIQTTLEGIKTITVKVEPLPKK